MKRMWVDVGCQMRATSNEMRSTSRAFALFTVCFGAPGGVSALYADINDHYIALCARTVFTMRVT